MQNNKKQEEQTKFKKEIKDKNKEYRISNFYFLLLLQILVIFISPFILEDQMFFRLIIENRHSTTSFDDYCNQSNKCRKHLYADQKIEQEDQQLFIEWKETLNQEKLILTEFSSNSLYFYPLIIIVQSILKNYTFLRKIQKVLYLIQLQSLCFFVRVLAPLMQRQLSTQINQYIINFFYFLLINIILFLVNQRYFQINLNLRNVAQPVMIFYFIVTFFQLLTNYFEVSNTQWAIMTGIMILINLYFLALNTYLFDEHNKFVQQNQSLIAIIYKSVNPFQIEDAYRDLAEDYFIISKKKSYVLIVGIIIMVYFRQEIFEYSVLIILGIIFILLIWDTSLISTSSKFTMKDSYLAANLFFLDFFLPLRNIVQFLIV